MTEPLVLSAIDQALKGLRYGTIQLTVHEGRLVRVERTERIRLDASPEQPTRSTGGPQQNLR